jgi:hypothetical protein
MNTFYMNDFSENYTNKNNFRQNMKGCMLYPEARMKVHWDLFITL